MFVLKVFYIEEPTYVTHTHPLYIVKHPKVSEEFITAVKADIKFSYLSKLMFIYKKNTGRI